MIKKNKIIILMIVSIMIAIISLIISLYIENFVELNNDSFNMMIISFFVAGTICGSATACLLYLSIKNYKGGNKNGESKRTKQT